MTGGIAGLATAGFNNLFVVQGGALANAALVGAGTLLLGRARRG
jgi:hypothetical protein